jgi:hypothetical protein
MPPREKRKRIIFGEGDDEVPGVAKAAGQGPKTLQEACEYVVTQLRSHHLAIPFNQVINN